MPVNQKPLKTESTSVEDTSRKIPPEKINVPESINKYPEQKKSVPAPEKTPDANFESHEKQPDDTEKTDNFLEENINNLKQKLKSNKKKTSKIPQLRDDITLEIEKTLEDGLGDAFDEMTVVEQQEFKLKGEETALLVRQMLKKTHVKVKNIFKLVLEWLRMLPGINRFFLEQEAKIKTDKILAIKERYKNKL